MVQISAVVSLNSHVQNSNRLTSKKISLHINCSSINSLSFPNFSQTLINTTLHPNLIQNTRIRYLSSMNFPIYHEYNSIKEHKTNSPQNTFIITLKQTITHFIPISPILSKRPSNSITEPNTSISE